MKKRKGGMGWDGKEKEGRERKDTKRNGRKKEKAEENIE